MEYLILIIAMNPPPPTGRPRGGSVPVSIFVNTALPRRTLEKPRGEGALINLQGLMIFMGWVRTPVHARFSFDPPITFLNNPALRLYLQGFFHEQAAIQSG